ncbi:hypothetical protein HUG12_09780 [Halorarum salinum]|uniref:Uncharacterized protein n=2 Tax=Halorarum salinum TaxID=2743089 RepID=A0A7D5LBB0_9EURY|nr:hypothetical protein HUG12_09780 [Halobaculum salinum]
MEEIVFEGEVEHNETPIDGKLGIWLNRKSSSFLKNLLHWATFRLFGLNRHVITLPADKEQAGDWRYGETVRVVVQKPDLDDIDGDSN